MPKKTAEPTAVAPATYADLLAETEAAALELQQTLAEDARRGLDPQDSGYREAHRVMLVNTIAKRLCAVEAVLRRLVDDQGGDL